MPYLFLLILISLLDQATKFIVLREMAPYQSIHLIPGYFTLLYTVNYGAAFSMFWSQRLILILITITVFTTVWLKRKMLSQYPKGFQLGLAIALGGALGNLIDRIRLGYVVDFLYLHIRSVFEWPVFNVADMAIVVGVGFIIWGLLFHKTSAIPASLEETTAEDRSE